MFVPHGVTLCLTAFQAVDELVFYHGLPGMALRRRRCQITKNISSG